MLVRILSDVDDKLADIQKTSKQFLRRKLSWFPRIYSSILKAVALLYIATCKSYPKQIKYPLFSSKYFACFPTKRMRKRFGGGGGSYVISSVPYTRAPGVFYTFLVEGFEWSGWLSSCGQINERQNSNARAIHSLRTAVYIVQFYTYKSKFQLPIISPTADETICFLYLQSQ